MLCAGLPDGGLQAMPPVQRLVLPNHLVLLASEEHSLPFVTLQLLIDSGSRRDPSGEEGLSYLTAKGVLQGTSKRTVNQINEELDFMGASLNSSSARDYATLSLRVLKKDLDKGLDLFMEVLTQPAFPEEEVKREVEKILAAIQSEEDQPEEVAEKAFLKTLFLSSPYGHPVEGTRDSVPKLTREGIVRFYRSYYHPNNAILTVIGDITNEELKEKLIPRADASMANNDVGLSDRPVDLHRLLPFFKGGRERQLGNLAPRPFFKAGDEFCFYFGIRNIPDNGQNGTMGMVIGTIEANDPFPCDLRNRFLGPLDRMAIRAVEEEGLQKCFFSNLFGLIFLRLNGCQRLFNFSIDLLLRKGGFGQYFHEEIKSLVQILFQNLEGKCYIVFPGRRIERRPHKIELLIDLIDSVLRRSQKKPPGGEGCQTLLSRRISPGARIDEELQCHKRQGVLLPTRRMSPLGRRVL